MSDVGYQEEESSTVTHDGADYSVNKILKAVQDKQTVLLRRSLFDWLLDGEVSEQDEKRIAATDLKYRIIYTIQKDKVTGKLRHVVLDGFHRLLKAKRKNVDFVHAVYISPEELKHCLV